ncbi:hypothetical protein EXIGLDRAFT_721541 [Exidia glandulosa HHB12029]|uniref:Uncharacterized protein n=1 Tax=Exidia glandulosa HHB12029 TaxID=1314781 RepID=A0A165FMW6_EXIGL|nr:hypothetical protein EXIGLDRAFT_736489 [Exidia glandulosa HHB12029]KZV89253.1 hypothetical protein EXIGLDRAFT_721541 [Exidia glandulosa HHB12029]
MSMFSRLSYIIAPPRMIHVPSDPSLDLQHERPRKHSFFAKMVRRRQSSPVLRPRDPPTPSTTACNRSFMEF